MTISKFRTKKDYMKVIIVIIGFIIYIAYDIASHKDLSGGITIPKQTQINSDRG